MSDKVIHALISSETSVGIFDLLDFLSKGEQRFVELPGCRFKLSDRFEQSCIFRL